MQAQEHTHQEVEKAPHHNVCGRLHTDYSTKQKARSTANWRTTTWHTTERAPCPCMTM